MNRKETTYQARIHQALDALLRRTLDDEAGRRTLDLAADRYVLFSDHHKGIRNGADDFRHSERAYHAALAYYYRMGYTLVVLGDAEELWEERPARVVNAYAYTLELEAHFHRDGRYLRFWGNHDDHWQSARAVRRRLTPIYRGEALQVFEGLCLQVMDGADEVGMLFLTHGHQGTATSDRWAGLSKLVVRFVWRPVQRFTGASLNTPARSWSLRKSHDVALYAWAEAQNRDPARNLVLITGHTHRPVFKSKAHAAQVREELAACEARWGAMPDDPALRRKVSRLAAELEWIRAQDLQKPGREGVHPMQKPCYFNTGCCSFTDGDITGLEIAEGAIRLVRWPDKEKKPTLQVLAEAPLKEVFAAC